MASERGPYLGHRNQHKPSISFNVERSSYVRNEKKTKQPGFKCAAPSAMTAHQNVRDSLTVGNLTPRLLEGNGVTAGSG